MKYSSIIPSLPAFLFPALLFLSCAGQAPPGGGPLDTVPPTITHTEPDTNAVMVKTDRIVLEFSEYVDRRSVEESIFISPYVGQLEFDWSGRQVTVTFSEKLRDSTTYVLNVGTDVVDVRAGNRMAHGFTLAFSTGTKIDQGMIKGRVFDAKPEGIMMFAYALGGIHADTLNPSHTKPDYIMQTGKDGTFTLANLRLNTYRVIAVQDEYRNLLYDRQIDRFGVTTGDVTLSAERPMVAGLSFRLSDEDTSRPFLTRVAPITRSYLQLRFSEELDSASFRTATITLEDTLTRKPIDILLRSLERFDSTVATVLTSVPLDSGRAYRLSVAHVFDRAGNPMDTANASTVFTGVERPDTLKPRFDVVGLRDSTREVPLENTFELRFTMPVRPVPLQTAIGVRDSAGRNLARTLRWITASSVFLTPEKPFQSNAWYSIRVVLDSVRDYFGNGYKDSVQTVHFQSLDLRTTGTLDGVVVDPDTEAHQGDIVLTTRRVSATPVEKTRRLPRPGIFHFEQLPEGGYTLQAYRDRDSSMSYSYGRPFPFLPSERFVVYPDTLKVRARWGVDGVSLKFPRME